MTTPPLPEIPEVSEVPERPPATTPPSGRGRFGRWHIQAAGEGEEESWLLTYLDVMTLLLVMMVVMLAFAKPASEDAGQGDGTGGPAAPRAQAPLTFIDEPPDEQPATRVAATRAATASAPTRAGSWMRDMSTSWCGP